MIHVELHNILSEADFVKDAHRVLTAVDSTKEVAVVTIGNRPAVAIIDLDQLEALTGKTVTPVAPLKPEIADTGAVKAQVPAVIQGTVEQTVQDTVVAPPSFTPITQPAFATETQPAALPPLPDLPPLPKLPDTPIPPTQAVAAAPSQPLEPTVPVEQGSGLQVTMPQTPDAPVIAAPLQQAPDFTPNPFLSRVQQNQFEEPDADLNSSSPMA